MSPHDWAAVCLACQNSAVPALRFAMVGAMVMSTLFPGAPVAAATPPEGVHATELWRRSADGVDYIFREITITPGGSTGWHWHTGRLYGVVKEGTLTHSRADCSLDGVYGPGAGIFEPSGPERVHIGRNLGPVPMVLQVLYVLPAGSALAEDAPDPGCGFD